MMAGESVLLLLLWPLLRRLMVQLVYATMFASSSTTSTTIRGGAWLMPAFGRGGAAVFTPRSRTSCFFQTPSSKRRLYSSPSSSSTAAAAKPQNSNTSTSGWIAWYSNKLDTHPLLTKGISSGLIAGGGDFLCQTAIEARSSRPNTATASYDIMRTVRFTILGTVVVAPFVHVWYAFLNKAVPGVAAVAVSKRVALDQFVFSPSFLSVRALDLGVAYILRALYLLLSGCTCYNNDSPLCKSEPSPVEPQIWLTCLWTMEGEGDAGILAHRVVQSMPALMVANWGLWIPAQVVNFRLVPVKFQVLYSNMVALVWNVYLSYSQTRKQTPQQPQTQFVEEQAQDD